MLLLAALVALIAIALGFGVAHALFWLLVVAVILLIVAVV
jgi:hypothetical protein